MPSRNYVEGYELSVVLQTRGTHWRGFVRIAGPDGEQLQTVETAARHATRADAERAALTIATDWVRLRVASE